MAEGVRSARFSDLILLWFMGVFLGCRPVAPGTGFRAFRRHHADRLGLPRVTGVDPARGDGRDVEPLLTARSRAAGLRVAEVPVAHYRQTGGGALLPGLTAILRERLARRHGAAALRAESIVVLTTGRSGSATTGLSHPSPAIPSRPAVTGSDRPAATGRTWPAATGSDRPAVTGSDRPAATGQTWPSPTGSDRPAASGQTWPSPTGPFRPAPTGPTPDSWPQPALGPYFAGPVNAPRQPAAGHRPADPGSRRWPAPNRIAAGSDHPNSTGVGLAERRRGGERRGPERRRTDPTPDRRAGTGRPGPGRDQPAAGGVNRRRWRDGPTDLNTGRRPDLRVINGEGSGSGGSRGHLRSV